MSFENLWSEKFINTLSMQLNLSESTEALQVIISKLTPLTFILLINLFVTLYLVFIAMLFILCNIIFRKRAISFIVCVVMNGVSMIMELGGGVINKLAFSRNIYIITSAENSWNYGTVIMPRLAYWGVLIVCIYILSTTIIKKRDYLYGEFL